MLRQLKKSTHYDRSSPDHGCDCCISGADGLLGSEFTCDSIDLNGDGANDSITVSPSGLGLDDGWISISPAQQAVMQRTIASPRGEIGFACRVAAVTDVNSDGWRDLAVASARESAAGGWRFHIRIYSSKTGELLGLLDREMSTSTDPLQFTTELDFDGAFAPAADPNRDQQVDFEDLVHVANSLGLVGEAPESDLDASGEGDQPRPSSSRTARECELKSRSDRPAWSGYE